MVLEDIILEEDVKEAKYKFIKLIISRLNLMLIVVNDLIDLKKLQQNTFKSVDKTFSPFDPLKYIMILF